MGKITKRYVDNEAFTYLDANALVDACNYAIDEAGQKTTKGDEFNAGSLPKTTDRIVVESDITKTGKWLYEYQTTRKHIEIDGKNHKVTFNGELRISSENAYVHDIELINTGSLASVSTSISEFGYQTNRKVLFKNCVFHNCQFYFQHDFRFENCTFINSKLAAAIAFGADGGKYVDNSLTNYDHNINGYVIGCVFICGANNTDNGNMIHFNFGGWNGHYVIDGCTFNNLGDLFMNDMIDTFDCCNIQITNCSFNTRNILGAEGIINVKSHSYNTSTPFECDKIGRKFNTIISNNVFNIDLTRYDEPHFYSAAIWVRNNRRDDADTIFNLRRNVLINGNCMNVMHKIGSNGKHYNGSTIALVMSQQGILNCSITNNVVYSEVGTIYLHIADSPATFAQYRNVLISGNNIMTPYGEKDQAENEYTASVNAALLKLPQDTNSENKIINFVVVNNIISGRDARNQTGTIDSQVIYKNNYIYDTRICLQLSMDYNPYHVDYNDKNNIINALSIGGLMMYHTEGTNLKDIMGNGSRTEYWGATRNRPSSELRKGMCYFDETLGKPIFWDGSKFVDANGNAV